MAVSYSDFIVPLIRSLRGEIMAAYGQVNHDVKGDNSVVTEIDRQVETKLIEVLQAEYPDIGFFGEEHGRRGSTDKYWLIDPIDGTESYVRGLPGVTSMLGLVENGEVTQSYIYDPVEDVMYSAFKGMGAYADDKKIEVANRPLDRSIIAVSSAMPYNNPELMRGMKAAGAYYISTYYGAGCKAVYFATGKVDGVVVHNSGGGLWDYAPTAFMMREAGAVFTEFDGKGLETRSYACLSPTINDQLLPVIKKEIL